MKAKVTSFIAAFDRLSGREQLMLVFVGLGLLAMFLMLGGFIVSRDLKARETRIVAKAKKLEELAGLRNDYQRRLSEQNQLAEMIRGNNGMRLLSFIEEVSKESGIDLGNAQERPGAVSGEILREEAAEVVIKNVSINRLYDFLRRVEDKNALVKVRRLKVQHHYENPLRLDATVTVGTFKTKESG